MHVGPSSVLGNFVVVCVKYLCDHRPFSFFAKTFKAYNSKNTEPIEPKITHKIRIGRMRLVGKFFFAPPSNIFAIIDLFLLSQKLLTFITKKILNRLSWNSHTTCVVVREVSRATFFAPVKYFCDHRPSYFFANSFNIYNSKNTEPIELKFTHNIRVGPVERGRSPTDVDRFRLVSPTALGQFQPGAKRPDTCSPANRPMGPTSAEVR